MELTPLTVGPAVSTTNASLSDNELPPPIVGNVNVAAFPGDVANAAGPESGVLLDGTYAWP